jgi:hypothetical protein
MYLIRNFILILKKWSVHFPENKFWDFSMETLVIKCRLKFWEGQIEANMSGYVDSTPMDCQTPILVYAYDWLQNVLKWPKFEEAPPQEFWRDS